MALQPSLTPYLRTFSLKNTRSFAAAAAAKVKESSFLVHPKEDAKTTTFDNVTVTSVETNKPLSKLAVYFKAGSRFEKDGNFGVVHALRIFSGLGTSGATHFGITRNIEIAGGNLSCSTGREHIAYTLEATRDKIQKCEKYLQDACMNQAFKPWELGDHLPRQKLDRILRPPEVRVLERLHKAAFRRGLGNSLYTPKYMLGKHDTEMLTQYVNSNFKEASVVAVGLPHEQVLDFARRLGIRSGARSTEASRYHGGAEVRKEAAGDLAYVAVALQGAGVDKPKEMIAGALIQRVLGSGPRTKRGVNSSGKLIAATKATPLESVATGFSTSYSDSGLVGVFLIAHNCCIEQLTKKSVELLRGTYVEADLVRAKSVLKADIAQSLESDAVLLDDMGLQSLLNKKFSSLEEVSRMIDSVTVGDLNTVIKNGGKLTMASYGNVHNVPYLDEL
jgi:ubiquinol-cytochrome c reductase core subunit 2